MAPVSGVNTSLFLSCIPCSSLGPVLAEIGYKSLALPGRWGGWSQDTSWVFAVPLGDVASAGDPVAGTSLLCYVTADSPERSSGVRAGDVSVGPDPQDVAQHTSPPRDSHQLCYRCVPGLWVQAGGELGLWGAWGTGMIEPGLQHRCGTGRSSCLQQLVCEPGPREVNQPRGRAQGAHIQ